MSTFWIIAFTVIRCTTVLGQNLQVTTLKCNVNDTVASPVQLSQLCGSDVSVTFSQTASSRIGPVSSQRLILFLSSLGPMLGPNHLAGEEPHIKIVGESPVPLNYNVETPYPLPSMQVQFPPWCGSFFLIAVLEAKNSAGVAVFSSQAKKIARKCRDEMEQGMKLAYNVTYIGDSGVTVNITKNGEIQTSGFVLKIINIGTVGMSARTFMSAFTLHSFAFRDPQTYGIYFQYVTDETEKISNLTLFSHLVLEFSRTNSYDQMYDFLDKPLRLSGLEGFFLAQDGATGRTLAPGEAIEINITAKLKFPLNKFSCSEDTPFILGFYMDTEDADSEPLTEDNTFILPAKFLSKNADYNPDVDPTCYLLPKTEEKVGTYIFSQFKDLTIPTYATIFYDAHSKAFQSVTMQAYQMLELLLGESHVTDLSKRLSTLDVCPNSSLDDDPKLATAQSVLNNGHALVTKLLQNVDAIDAGEAVKDTKSYAVALLNLLQKYLEAILSSNEKAQQFLLPIALMATRNHALLQKSLAKMQENGINREIMQFLMGNRGFPYEQFGWGNDWNMNIPPDYGGGIGMGYWGYGGGDYGMGMGQGGGGNDSYDQTDFPESSNTTNDDMFDCGDGNFTYVTFVCDNFLDCPNGRDEINCTAKRSVSEGDYNEMTEKATRSGRPKRADVEIKETQQLLRPKPKPKDINNPASKTTTNPPASSTSTPAANLRTNPDATPSTNPSASSTPNPLNQRIVPAEVTVNPLNQPTHRNTGSESGGRRRQNSNGRQLNAGAAGGSPQGKKTGIRDLGGYSYEYSSQESNPYDDNSLEDNDGSNDINDRAGPQRKSGKNNRLATEEAGRQGNVRHHLFPFNGTFVPGYRFHHHNWTNWINWTNWTIPNFFGRRPGRGRGRFGGRFGFFGRGRRVLTDQELDENEMMKRILEKTFRQGLIDMIQDATPLRPGISTMTGQGQSSQGQGRGKTRSSRPIRNKQHPYGLNQHRMSKQDEDSLRLLLQLYIRIASTSSITPEKLSEYSFLPVSLRKAFIDYFKFDQSEMNVTQNIEMAWITFRLNPNNSERIMKLEELSKKVGQKFVANPLPLNNLLESLEELVNCVIDVTTEAQLQFSGNSGFRESMKFFGDLLRSVLAVINSTEADKLQERLTLDLFDPGEMDRLQSRPGKEPSKESYCQMAARKFLSPPKSKTAEQNDDPFFDFSDLAPKAAEKAVFWMQTKDDIYEGERSSLFGVMFWKKIAICHCRQNNYSPNSGQYGGHGGYFTPYKGGNSNYFGREGSRAKRGTRNNEIDSPSTSTNIDPNVQKLNLAEGEFGLPNVDSPFKTDPLSPENTYPNMETYPEEGEDEKVEVKFPSEDELKELIQEEINRRKSISFPNQLGSNPRGKGSQISRRTLALEDQNVGNILPLGNKGSEYSLNLRGQLVWFNHSQMVVAGIVTVERLHRDKITRDIGTVCGEGFGKPEAKVVCAEISKRYVFPLVQSLAVDGLEEMKCTLQVMEEMRFMHPIKLARVKCQDGDVDLVKDCENGGWGFDSGCLYYNRAVVNCVFQRNN